MNKIVAIKIMLGLLLTVIVFHICIIIKIIPYEIAWGGRLKNDGEMYVFETVSILINLLLIFTFLMKGNYIKQYFNKNKQNVFLWIFFFLFSINTIGNLFAKTFFEKTFSGLTLISALLIWIIIKKDTKNLNQQSIK